MSDQYDRQIRRLKRNPRLIEDDWCMGLGLFQFVTPDGRIRDNCGCLSMIRDPDLGHGACTPELTAEIRADERLPADPADITPAHLPVFAEWQRRLDKEIRGK